jgi:hypothetical protein
MNKVLLWLGLACVALVVVWLVLSRGILDRSPTTTLFCGADQTDPVVVYKDPASAFPSFIKDLSAQLKGSAQLLDSLQGLRAPQASGSVELQEEITLLRDRLDQHGAQMELLLKTSFISVNQRPCDATVRERHPALIDQMAKDMNDLAVLRAELTKPASKGGPARPIIDPDTANNKMALRRFKERFILNEAVRSLVKPQ